MFNDHFIRGKKKMELMLNLTFIVMLTIAKGHIKQKNIRSLVSLKKSTKKQNIISQRM